jgi:hypothetical protein
MRFVRLALGTTTVICGLLLTVAAALGGFDYVSCRGWLAQFSGRDRALFTAVCNYDMRLTVEAGALALAFGVVTYFLLRSRWRGKAPVASTLN